MNLAEQREIVELGNQAAAFVNQPFFKKHLDFLAEQGDSLLRRLKASPIETHPRTKELWLLEWQTWERILLLAQQYPYTLIKQAQEAQLAQVEENAVA